MRWLIHSLLIWQQLHGAPLQQPARGPQLPSVCNHGRVIHQAAALQQRGRQGGPLLRESMCDGEAAVANSSCFAGVVLGVRVVAGRRLVIVGPSLHTNVKPLYLHSATSSPALLMNSSIVAGCCTPTSNSTAAALTCAPGAAPSRSASTAVPGASSSQPLAASAAPTAACSAEHRDQWPNGSRLICFDRVGLRLGASGGRLIHAAGNMRQRAVQFCR